MGFEKGLQVMLMSLCWAQRPSHLLCSLSDYVPILPLLVLLQKVLLVMSQLVLVISSIDENIVLLILSLIFLSFLHPGLSSTLLLYRGLSVLVCGSHTLLCCHLSTCLSYQRVNLWKPSEVCPVLKPYVAVPGTQAQLIFQHSVNEQVWTQGTTWDTGD